MTSIVFALPSLRGGGAEFVTRVWAEELTKRGHDVTVVLLAHEENEPQIDARVELLCARSASRFSQISALRRYITTQRPAIAVAMMTRTNFQLLFSSLLVPRSARPKIAISERNMPFTEKTDTWLHVRIRNFALRWLYPKADQFLAISHPVGAAFSAVARLEPSRVWLVPNPATAKSGAPIVPARAKTDTLSIVVPGRLVDKKRPTLALDVADRVADSFSSIQVIYFGEGPLDTPLSQQQRGYPIELRGRVENWFDHLPADAVVLLPSAVEGFGNVLVEAATRGVPSVVGSSAWGSADAMIPGVTGVFARNDSIAEYAIAVLAAAQLETTTPRQWLDTFSSTSSTDILERALAELEVAE